jgi:hypothetical protein
MTRAQPNLLDDNQTLHMRVLGPRLLHLWCRTADKVRSNLHAGLERIMGAPSRRQDEDGAIVKIRPSWRILGRAARVQIAQIYKVVLRPDQAVWRHSAPGRDAVQPAQVDIVIVCS